MMADMPTDEEFMLIETLKLATLRERRYMALLARYNELLKNSPDGMILKEDIRVLTKESNAFGNVSVANNIKRLRHNKQRLTQ